MTDWRAQARKVRQQTDLLSLTKDQVEDIIAAALERAAEAQREKDAKTLEDLASAGAKFGLRPNATLLEAAAAIRSAP